ncbi:MAG: hypothetical protein OXC14_05245 [Rhodospirillaceae bacterium]|nr:hypothetical protein [Rhodospirillaceae bacterium]
MDAGMEHFTGARMASLAREIIQNSLDARDDPKQAVEVSFEIKELPAPAEFRREELRNHVDACVREAEQAENEQAKRFFERAAELLDKPKMRFLRVSDLNTTGLRPKQWMALVKSRGLSVKASLGAGGSFGIGKSAPFVVSGIRTVLYWTAYEENGTVEERFQGVSILMSHNATINGEEEETQGTGFLGRIEKCLELAGDECPEQFRYLGQDREPIQGTSLWIAEMQAAEEWQRDLASSVIANYFHAIQNKTLKVLLEPSRSEDRWEIDLSTLADWFSDFQADSDGAAERVGQARPFWELTREYTDAATEERTWEDQVLGRCRLRIRVGEGLPRRVGLIRKSGMLITSDQRGLQRFPRTRDFAAVCVFESDEANEFLRGMENPKHDQFEPERLPDEGVRRQGRQALDRFIKWTRDQIREVAGQKSEEVSEDLDELAEYLPDEETAGPFADADGGTKEKGFGGAVKVTTRRPKLRRVYAPIIEDRANGEDGEGDDGGDAGGSAEPGNGSGGRGPSQGPGEGEGKGGTGSKGGTAGSQSVPVGDVRVLAVPGTDHYRLSFTPGPGVAGAVRVELQEAGDSTAEPRTDLFVAGAPRTKLSDHELQVRDGRRTSVDFVGEGTVSGRAWHLTLVAQAES